MYVCICVCMYVCMYVYVYVCIYVCMYICIHVYMYTCIHVYMYIFTHEGGELEALALVELYVVITIIIVITTGTSINGCSSKITLDNSRAARMV